jgi:hypothetical protein
MNATSNKAPGKRYKAKRRKRAWRVKWKAKAQQKRRERAYWADMDRYIALSYT